MIEAFEFLQATNGFKPSSSSNFRLATIDPTYTSGKPSVTFDGESTVSTKTFTYLGSYTPVASDRVLMVRVGSSWVILGEVINS